MQGQADSSKEKRYPISEIFCNTIQGEGPRIGTRCHFLRFAGCDFDCGADQGNGEGKFICDTRYAVHHKYAGWKRELLTSAEILERMKQQGAEPGDWICLSGGNPALFYDKELAEQIEALYQTQMETQGSRMFTGLPYVDLLIISPKPPSSNMAEKNDISIVDELIDNSTGNVVMKYVAFDQEDLEWIIKFDSQIEHDHILTGRYLSAGTPPKMDKGRIDLLQIDAERLDVCNSYSWLAQTTLADPRFKDFTILMQAHVLIWGQKAGV